MQTDINSIPKQDYLVLCSTITYQHAAYIEDTMNGFVMQQTSFPFACYIIDDASTDGEPEVIKAYLDKNFQMDTAERYELELADVIVAKHNTNPNCTFAVYLLRRNLWKEPDLKRPLGQPWRDRSKYIACCEGDDYWTDPLKLQKQVDFLEEHEEYSMCFHAAEIKNEAGTKELITCKEIENKEYFTNDIFPGWVIPTASVVYRKAMVDKYPPLKHTEWMKFGDIVLFLKCTHTGRVWGMSEKMSVYRMTEGGAVISQKNEKDYKDRMCRHYQFLMENFSQLDKTWPSNYIATWYYTKFRSGKKLNDLWVATKYAPVYVMKKLLGLKVDGTY